MKPLVVVLGASGRLGGRLVPLLSAAGLDTIAAGRSSATRQLPGVEWFTGDLSDRSDQERVIAAVDERCDGRVRVVAVDLVLDRSGIDGMRRSVQAATDTVLRLRDLLREGSAQLHLIAATTTAVLAPDLYQTPYGLTKRRQVVTYARAGIPGTALLLPLLREPTGDTASRPCPGWTFDRAASNVCAAANGASSTTFVVKVPHLSGDGLLAAGRKRALISETFMSHLECMLTDPNSMQAHRRAARSRLRLSPLPLRRRVDHHLAPAALVRRFADRYDVTIVRECVELCPGGGSPSHA